MNLAPGSTSEGGPPLAPPEWTMTVGVDHKGLVTHYYADVMKGPARICRVSLTSPSRSEEEARAALAEKARAWIADYLSRSHSVE